MCSVKSQLIFWFKPVLFAALALLHVSVANAQIPKTVAQLKKMLAESKGDQSRTEILLDLGAEYLNRPWALKSDLDSAKLFNRQAFKLGNQLKYRRGIGRSLLLEGQIYHEIGDEKHSWELLQKTVNYCNSYQLYHQVGEAYTAMSVHFSNEGSDLEKRILYNKRAAEYFEKASSKIELAQSLEVLGDLYQIKGEQDTAIVLLKRSIAIYDSVGFKRTHGAYNLLGFVYYFKGNNYNALRYLLKAVKIAEELHDTSQLATIYNRLGSVYMILLEYEKALGAWTKGLEVAKNINDNNSANELKLRIINLLRKEKKYNQALAILRSVDNSVSDEDVKTSCKYEYANIFLNMKQYKRSKLYVDSLQFITKEFPDDRWVWTCYYLTSIKYHFHTRQYKEANLAVVGQDAIGKMNYSISSLTEYYLYWSKIDSAMGNDASALKHFKIYNVLSDSVVKSRSSKQLSELQLQYDTEKKDQNIHLLTQKSQLQQTRIHNQEMIRNVFIAGLLVLFAFSGLMYNRYSLKQRVNEKLASKQDEINGQNKMLLKLLEEKEWLLKEIHHRVKNNLQIVISLLNSQSAFLENKDALAAIQNSQNRMHAMSLIHQKLYQSGDVASVDMNWYIHELVNYTKESFHLNRRIGFLLDIDPLDLDVAQAVPLGLILNEAITNSVKYAFPENEKGKITINLKASKNGACRLTIADNGVGLPDDFDLLTVESLGMSLMQGLSEQLDGNFELQNDSGLHLSITFQKSRQMSIS